MTHRILTLIKKQLQQFQKNMKLTIIDTKNAVFNSLGGEKSGFSLVDPKDDNLQEIAKKVTKKRPDAIIINIEAAYEGSRPSDYKGIELIYWLRLKYKYLGAIITYGFSSLQQILEAKPEDIVITAPGNNYYRLPIPFRKIMTFCTIDKSTSDTVKGDSD